MDGVESAIKPTHYISGRRARALTTAQSLRHANSLGNKHNDDKDDENVTQWHIWQRKTVILHHLHVLFSFLYIFIAFLVLFRRQKLSVLQFCERRKNLRTIFCYEPPGELHTNLWDACGFLGAPHCSISRQSRFFVRRYDFKQVYVPRCHHNLMMFYSSPSPLSIILTICNF